MNREDLLNQCKALLDVSSDKDVADLIGVNKQAINHFKRPPKQEVPAVLLLSAVLERIDTGGQSPAAERMAKVKALGLEPVIDEMIKAFEARP